MRKVKSVLEGNRVVNDEMKIVDVFFNKMTIILPLVRYHGTMWYLINESRIMNESTHT